MKETLEGMTRHRPAIPQREVGVHTLEAADAFDVALTADLRTPEDMER